MRSIWMKTPLECALVLEDRGEVAGGSLCQAPACFWERWAPSKNLSDCGPPTPFFATLAFYFISRCLVMLPALLTALGLMPQRTRWISYPQKTIIYETLIIKGSASQGSKLFVGIPVYNIHNDLMRKGPTMFSFVTLCSHFPWQYSRLSEEETKAERG